MSISNNDDNVRGVFRGTLAGVTTIVLVYLSETFREDYESRLGGLKWVRGPLEDGLSDFVRNDVEEVQKRLDKYSKDLNPRTVPRAIASKYSSELVNELNRFESVNQDYTLSVNANRFVGDLEQREHVHYHDSIASISVFLAGIGFLLLRSNFLKFLNSRKSNIGKD